MRKLQFTVISLFILAMLIVPCRAFAFLGLEAGLGYWQQTPSGTLSYKPLANSVGDVDLKNDLFFTSETKPFVRVRAELPLILPNIYFMATPMTFQGSGTISRDISFSGINFGIGVPIESKLKLDHYDLTLFYPIPFLKTATLGILNVNLCLNGRMVDFEGTINGGGQHATKSLRLTGPMLFVAVQVKPIKLFSIEAEFRGLSAGSNSFYDTIGRLKINPIPVLYVAGGYRMETLKVDAQEVNADVKFAGPFAEVGVSF